MAKNFIKGDDPPDSAGIHHRFIVGNKAMHPHELCVVNFQKDDPRKHGWRGVTETDLLRLVLERLKNIQDCEMGYEEDIVAMKHIRAAIKELNKNDHIFGVYSS